MDQKSIVTDKNKDHLVMLIERSTKDLHDRIDTQKFILLKVLGRTGDNVPVGLCSVLDDSLLHVSFEWHIHFAVA